MLDKVTRILFSCFFATLAFIFFVWIWGGMYADALHKYNQEGYSLFFILSATLVCVGLSSAPMLLCCLVCTILKGD